MSKPHQHFADMLDSAVRSVVFALNAYDKPPTLKAIDAIRKQLEEHALAFAALGAAYPRVFTPGPTLEQLEERMGDDDHSKRDTRPGYRSTGHPPPLQAPPPIGDNTPPPLPRGRR